MYGFDDHLISGVHNSFAMAVMEANPEFQH